MRNKLRNRVSLFLAFILIIGGIFFIIDIKIYFKKLQDDIVKQYVNGKVKAIEQSINYIKDNMSKVMFEYAVWDETYTNLIAHNYSWIEKNVTRYIYDNSNYDVDFVYLEDKNKEYVQYLGDRKLFDGIKKTKNWIDKGLLTSINTNLAYINGDLYVVSVSPVKNTNASKTYGVMMLAKRYKLQELEEIFKPYLGVEASGIIYEDKVKNEKTYAIAEDNRIDVFYNLLDESWKVLKKLKFSFDLSTYLKSINAALYGIITIAVIVVFLVGAIVVYYISIVAKKCRILSRKLTGWRWVIIQI